MAQDQCQRVAEEGDAMTPEQQKTVNARQAQGFKVVAKDRDVIRLTNGADKRVVFPDGSEKRGNHYVARG